MVNVGTFFQKNPTTKFIVKNIAPGNKRIRVFAYPINNGETRDLLAIPGVSESNIRHSLLKGELLIKIKYKELIIIDSDIDLLQFNPDQLLFLQSSGVTKGLQVDSSNFIHPFISDTLLTGTKNGINTSFTLSTGDKFVYNSTYVITVYVNGVRQAYTSNFIISESGGVGTGYDTIIFIEAPSAQDILIADYFKR